MTRHDTQSWFRRFFASRLFLIVALVVSLLFAFGYARAYYQDYKLKQEIKQLQEDVQSLEKKKLESLDILQYVMSNTYVEDAARTELHMKKPGENVIVVTGGQRRNETQKEVVVATGQTVINPVKWWYYFLHKPLPERS